MQIALETVQIQSQKHHWPWFGCYCSALICCSSFYLPSILLQMTKKVKIAIEFASTHVQKQFHVVNVCCPGMRIEIHLMQ